MIAINPNITCWPVGSRWHDHRAGQGSAVAQKQLLLWGLPEARARNPVPQSKKKGLPDTYPFSSSAHPSRDCIVATMGQTHRDMPAACSLIRKSPGRQAEEQTWECGEFGPDPLHLPLKYIIKVSCCFLPISAEPFVLGHC